MSVILSKISRKYSRLELTQFQYTLPEQLIAQFPLACRTDCRLLSVNGKTGSMDDLVFTGITRLLKAGDLLVLNDTRVIPARLYGRKKSGGRIEILIERIINSQSALTQIRASKALKIGSVFRLEGESPDSEARLEKRRGAFYVVQFTSPVMEVLRRSGHVPLPPYIKRNDMPIDVANYQTVYARHFGAVAAPTAGLHFDDALLNQLCKRGVNTAFLTLHVGAGSFQPVRVDNATQHRMHAEWINVSPTLCEQIYETRKHGGKLVAVGTTVVRALETASSSGVIKPFEGDTSLFIYPGYRFHVVDALITNFHLPGSTLLMLVCAFAGTDRTLAAYSYAIKNGYRFYSYGDAMFVTRDEDALNDDAA